MQQYVGDLLSVGGRECHHAFCGVLGKKSIIVKDCSRINKMIHKAENIIVHNLETLQTVRERSELNRLVSIMDNPSHLLHDTLNGQQSFFPN